MELKDLLIGVISSWQVIVATVVVLLYGFLVSYVARLYHRPRAPSYKPKLSSRKEKAAMPVVSDEDDDLGLEEE